MLVADIAVRCQRQVLLGNCRPADVSAEPFELLASIRSLRRILDLRHESPPPTAGADEPACAFQIETETREKRGSASVIPRSSQES